MTAAERYRSLAADLRARAGREESSQLRAEWLHLADCYGRLAEEADRRDGMAAGQVLPRH